MDSVALMAAPPLQVLFNRAVLSLWAGDREALDWAMAGGRGELFFAAFWRISERCARTRAAMTRVFGTAFTREDHPIVVRVEAERAACVRQLVDYAPAALGEDRRRVFAAVEAQRAARRGHAPPPAGGLFDLVQDPTP